MASRHLLRTRVKPRSTTNRLVSVLTSVAMLAGTVTTVAVTSIVAAPSATAATGATGTAGLFVPSQVRAMDTRNGNGGYTTKMVAGSWRTVSIDGIGDIPASGVSSVQVTLTVVVPTGSGIANAEASDSTTTPSNAPSALIYNSGVTGTISATTIVAVGADGKIKASTQTSEDLIIDVQGYYTANGGAAAPGGYVPITPKRIVDTRSGLGSTTGPVAANSTSTYQIAGGTSGVPVGASAVFALLTPVSTSPTSSYFTPYPTGAALPNISINYPGNLATVIGEAVDLNNAGSFNVKFAGGGINFIVDVLGYYTATPGVSGAYTPAATRVYDSRVAPNVSIPANTTVSVPIAGIKGVPLAGGGISAVGINLQVSKGNNTSGFVRMWAADQSEPTPTMVDYPTQSSIRTNFVVVAPGADGAVKIHNIGANPIDVILDVSGWYSNVGTAVSGNQTRTQKFLTLQATVGGGGPWATYQYRKGITGAFTNVPVADVTVPGTTTHPAGWPVTTTSGNFDPYTWDLATTVGGGDQLVQVRACYGDTSATTPGNLVCSMPTDIQLATHAFGDSYDIQHVGPGKLATMTGDYEITASDATESSYLGTLTVSRSATTLAPTPEQANASGVFGPGWTSDLTGPDAGHGREAVTDNSAQGFLTFTDPDGGATLYQASTAIGSYPISFIPVGDAAGDGTTVAKTSAAIIVMTDSDGTQTTWKSTSTGWHVDSVAQATSVDTTSYTFDPTTGLPARILGAVPPGVTCTNPDNTRGCRSLTFSYTTVTVAGAPKTRLAGISLSAYNPATSAMALTPVAAYAYDSNGRLAQEWDPRITPNLKTNYTYYSNNRLATITPPGLATWTLSYDTNGRLSTTSRPDPSGAIGTSTVIYQVPFTGTGAPIDVGATTSAAWGQTGDPAAIGAAVFSPNHTPAGTTSASITSTDWPYATMNFLDANGRNVNTASYGAGAWQTDATMYDSNGNTVWQLTPGNRAQALSPTNDTDPTAAAASSSAARAALLATSIAYNPLNPAEVTDTLGPIHPVTLTDNTVKHARTHSATTYDEGAPPDGTTYGLPTTQAKGAQTTDGVDYDTVTTRLGYTAIAAGDTTGWSLRQSTSSTTQMGAAPSSADLTTITRYNSAGQTIETRLPVGSAGGDARSTITTYYTGTGTGPCSSPDLAGLPCTTGPAAQPTVGNPLAVITTTYNMYGAPLTKTSSYGAITKTIIDGYDTAGRATSSSLTVSPTAAGGTAVPPVTYSYDASTGLPATSSAGGKSLTSTYDTLGQIISYTDATGNTANFSHDVAGRPIQDTDGHGTSAFSYDNLSEHRNLAISEDAGAGAALSTFSATYNADGQIATQTYPNGIVVTTTYDNTGAPTGLTYRKEQTTWLSFQETHDSQGRVATQNGPTSAQRYLYDRDSRLNLVADTVGSGTTATCTTRVYTFDMNSNRTQLASYADGGGMSGGNCTTSTPSTNDNYGYDQADRISNTGYSYDLLGRTLTVPAQQAPGSGSKSGAAGNLTLGYFGNDMVNSETQGGRSRTFSIDPQQNRVLTTVDSGVSTTAHYIDNHDSPAWTSTGTSWSRNIRGLDGKLTAVQASDGTVSLQLTNMHGDVVATVADDSFASAPTTLYDYTEFGAPRQPATSIDVYGWLGGPQRSSDALGGLMIMGMRLYNPSIGRFLTIDPLSGSGPNAYDYAAQDPINQVDFSGQAHSFYHVLNKGLLSAHIWRDRFGWLAHVYIWSTFDMWDAGISIDIYGTRGFTLVQHSIHPWFEPAGSWSWGGRLPLRGRLIGVWISAWASGIWPWDYSSGGGWLDDRNN